MPTVEIITEKDREMWDENIAKFDNVHPLCAFGWGNVRRVDGWTPLYFLVKDSEKTLGAMTVLIKKIPLLGFSIMYGPRGPLFNFYNTSTLSILIKRIREEARKRNAIFLRIDPSIEEDKITDGNDPFIHEGFFHLGHRWTFWNTPRDVYRIDLKKANSVSELFGVLNRDARRCVRKAEKEGVSIRQGKTVEELELFYEIFKEFSVGKGFMARGLRYQKELWNEYIMKNNGRLFLAEYKGKIIGGLICLMFGKKCLAMHMGSPYQYQKLQTYYAYIWESMKWAWENGCVWYSFRGVGTTPTQEYFKKKFGPKVVSLVGYYDLPFRLNLYKIFYFIEFEGLPRIWRFIMKIRRILHKFNNKKK